METYDTKFMRAAIAVGLKGQGRTADNPSVGCVIVAQNSFGEPIVIAAARTQNGGRPHAEVQALKEAGEKAKGATLYVTLEPCAHIGHTGPCTKAVIEAGIKRVVVGVEDPDIRTKGKGIEILKSVGIDITIGVCGDEIRYALAGHILKVLENRPFITAKMAITANNIIADVNGRPLKITGENTNRFTHLMRMTHNGIAVGYRTYLNDKPSLTARLEGTRGRNPKRFVFYDDAREHEIENVFQKINLPSNVAADWEDALANIVECEVTRLFVETGVTLFNRMVQQQIPDRIILYRSKYDGPKDGVKGLLENDENDEYAFGHLPQYTRTRILNFGSDTAHIFHHTSRYLGDGIENLEHLREEF